MPDIAAFQPQDLARLPEITAADLAPDGGFTVYAATTRDGQSAIEYPLLWRQELGGTPELLLDAQEAQDAPALSPDGRRVAFLRHIDGRRQLAVLDLTDHSERTLTDFARGAGAAAPSWSPDGTTVAFTASDAPVRDPARPYRITRPVWRRDAMGLIDDVSADLWTVPAAGGAATRLTFHDGVVSAPEWSPDGSRILYNCFAEPDSTSFAIRTVNPDGSDVRLVMSGDYLVYPPAAAWLSDGRIVRTTAWDVYLPLDLVVHDPTTGADTPLGTAFDGQIFGHLQGGMNSALFEPRLVVDRATDNVYLCVQTGGRLEVHRLRVSDGATQMLAEGEYSTNPLAVRGTNLLMARTSFSSPATLIVADLESGAERSAANLDRNWLERMPFNPRELHFLGQDGTPVHGWFLEPLNGEGPYPTVLSIHGGPFAAQGHAFSIDHHLLTSAGYGVLLVNFRGSSGYGEDFAKCLIGDWGHHDAGDLLAGVDHALSLGLIDPARLGSFGLSGGGYLTSWLLTHSDRFSAGVAESPVTDWNVMVGSDIPQVVARWMGAAPGSGPAGMAEYARVAPATYAAACTTPMLIIEHEADLRCPTGQGDVMYNALHAAGCTTEMLRLPGMFHGDVYRARDLPGRIERLDAIRDWFDRFMRARKS